MCHKVMDMPRFELARHVMGVSLRRFIWRGYFGIVGAGLLIDK